MNWKELTANIIAKAGGIVAIVFGILAFLLGALFVVVGLIISLTIILAIIGVPAIVFGFFLMVGASTMVWAGLTAILWKPKFEPSKNKKRKILGASLTLTILVSLFYGIYWFVDSVFLAPYKPDFKVVSASYNATSYTIGSGEYRRFFTSTLYLWIVDSSIDRLTHLYFEDEHGTLIKSGNIENWYGWREAGTGLAGSLFDEARPKIPRELFPNYEEVMEKYSEWYPKVYSFRNCTIVTAKIDIEADIRWIGFLDRGNQGEVTWTNVTVYVIG